MNANRANYSAKKDERFEKYMPAKTETKASFDVSTLTPEQLAYIESLKK